MKYIMLALVAAFALTGIAVTPAQAEDRVPGLRYEDVTPNKAQGETKRTKSFNRTGDLVGVKVQYSNGRVRNESYTKGVLKAVHETDFKGWSLDAVYQDANNLVTQRVRDKSGKTTHYVNIDVVKSGTVNLSVGDELYLIKTRDVWPGHRSDAANLTKGSLKALAAAPANLPDGATLISGGSYSAPSTGNSDITVETTITTAGFPGPHGAPPKRTKTTSTLEVLVK